MKYINAIKLIFSVLYYSLKCKQIKKDSTKMDVLFLLLCTCNYLSLFLDRNRCLFILLKYFGSNHDFNHK